MQTISIVIAILSLVAAGLAVWLTMSLRSRFRSALINADGQNLEETLTQHLKKVQVVAANQTELSEAYRKLAAQVSLASQKISIVRFNPFGDTGGDQSFVLAVLDAHDSGYVLTSIHGREGTRVYVKPIDYGKSKYTLSAEESQALKQASDRVPGKKE